MTFNRTSQEFVQKAYNITVVKKINHGGILEGYCIQVVSKSKHGSLVASTSIFEFTRSVIVTANFSVQKAMNKGCGLYYGIKVLPSKP